MKTIQLEFPQEHLIKLGLARANETRVSEHLLATLLLSLPEEADHYEMEKEMNGVEEVSRQRKGTGLGTEHSCCC